MFSWEFQNFGQIFMESLGNKYKKQTTTAQIQTFTKRSHK